MTRSSPLFAGYAAEPGRYHEPFGADGTVRPHWRALVAELERASAAQMRQRREFVARQIRENGVTYNVYDDANGTERPWDLDLLPNLIDAAEWETLAAGVAQRAALLDAVLADLYGPQRLLRDGSLPADLVFGQRDFVWACRGVAPPGGTFLHVYAVDLARAPDGRWWVLADRTQAPSGAGYALENRHIVSHAFAEAFRALKARPLDGFFGALQTLLQRLAPAGTEAPLGVLLTPGRYNETYFEHVYLARALGVPLVEGQDLIVRGATVFLKTLGGLQRVHAILRRVDSDFCDPLELRGDSALGVPGLLEAVRAGRVAVANALGSGVLETPGLLGFLPRICERLRGEPLALPTVATWWCGEPPACAEALANLARLVVKPAFPSRRFEPVFAPALGRAGLAELGARIRRQPQAYVAQELIDLSHAPVWRGGAAGRLAARAIGLRLYAVAGERGYVVMPGGLTRVAARSDARVVSMQAGGGSKDTWVLGDGRSAAGEAQRRALGVRDVVRTDAFLPSRLIENLFWFGRYSERCDDVTRLLRIVLARYVGGGPGAPALAGALEVCRAFELTPPKRALKPALLAAVGGGAAGGLRDTLARLFGAAAQVRGRLSQENWRGIVELQRAAQALAERPPPDLGDALDVLDGLLMSVSALSGFAFDDMTRDEGWRFLVIGRRLERLQFLADVVAVALRGLAAGRRDEAATLDWVLELADSVITYRMRYLSAPQLIPALDLVVLDAANPHAVLFQIRELARELGAVGGGADVAAMRALDERVGACDLAALEPSLLGDAGRRDAIAGLADRLAEVAAAARAASDRLSARHFAHVDDVTRPTVSA